MAKIRLLICEHDGAVEELPDYEGPWQNDTWLNEKLTHHMLPSGEKTHGNVHVARIDQSDWISHRDDIVNKMAAEFTIPGKGAGLGQTFYDVKDNYSHDALKCWVQGHNRTTDCGDYMSSKMKVLPDTRAERKAAGVDYKNRPGFFLCELCPYHQILQQREGSHEFGYNYST